MKRKKRVEERENIEVLFECNAIGLFGEDGVEGAKIVRRKGDPEEEVFSLPIDGFFLAIGHKPNTDVFKPECKLVPYLVGHQLIFG